MKKRCLIIAFIFISSTSFSQNESDIIAALLKAKNKKEKIDLLTKLTKTGTKQSQYILIDILEKDEDPETRQAAAATLGQIKAGRHALQKAYKNEGTMVRRSIMEALARIADPANIDFFKKYYFDPDQHISYWAFMGLAETGDSRHLPIYYDALRRDWKLSQAKELALIDIGKFGNRHQDWGKIEPFFHDKNKALLRAAIIAAGHLKNKKAIPYLVKNMSHTDNEFSRLAILALGNYSGYRPLKELVLFALNNKNHANRKELLATITKLKPASAFAVLNQAMNLRREHSIRAKIIAILRPKQVVEVLSISKKKFDFYDPEKKETKVDFWYQVKTHTGQQGYLFGAYLSVVKIKE